VDAGQLGRAQRGVSPISAPDPSTMLITPGGRPACSSSFIRKYVE